MAARTGAVAQAVKTRACAPQGVAVDAGDGGTGGSRLRLARDAVAQGSAPAVAVHTDACDGGSGGSGLRLARALKRLGRGEDEVCEKPNQPPPHPHPPPPPPPPPPPYSPHPPFISHQRQSKGPFPLNFAIIANLSLFTTCTSNFSALKY